MNETERGTKTQFFSPTFEVGGSVNAKRCLLAVFSREHVQTTARFCLYTGVA
jgi:hypothetical protein